MSHIINKSKKILLTNVKSYLIGCRKNRGNITKNMLSNSGKFYRNLHGIVLHHIAYKSVTWGPFAGQTPVISKLYSIVGLLHWGQLVSYPTDEAQSSAWTWIRTCNFASLVKNQVRCTINILQKGEWFNIKYNNL